MHNSPNLNNIQNNDLAYHILRPRIKDDPFISNHSNLQPLVRITNLMSEHVINVLNPERHGGDGLNTSYISYEITSDFDGKEFKVRRRYQDFLWLVDQLKHHFPERIIPPLPDKNRLEYLGRFTPDFIKRRQLGLKRFLWRIDAHPLLRDSETFSNFLTAPVVGANLRVRNNSEASMACDSKESLTSTTSAYLKPVIESLGDVLSSTTLFTRSPKQVPEPFLKLKKEIKMVKGHLSHLERLFSNRVSGHQPAIIEGMKEIAGNFDELAASIDLSLNHEAISQSSVSPPFVKSMLSRVSATMTQCAHLLDKSIDNQELNLLAVLLEYTQYCDSALEIIETRDRRQVEVEELTKLVEGYEKEIEELDGVKTTSITCEEGSEQQNTNNRTSSGSFYDYLSSKWDSWKGVDPITARKNRLEKVQSRLNETKAALKTSLHLSSLLDSSLSQEIAVFLSTLKEELGREFSNHSRSQVNYHETNLIYWKDFLAWLDNPPKHL